MGKASRFLGAALAAGALALVGAGCQNGKDSAADADAEQTGAEHPQGEHPQGDHPEGEHPGG